MNSSNNLTIEEKIDEILDGLPSAWCDDCRHPRCISKKKSVKQQLLSLLEEEKKYSWKDGYEKGWRARNDNQKKTRRSVSGSCLTSTEVDKSLIPQDRLQALKQESKK
jgi:hypothetical protein